VAERYPIASVLQDLRDVMIPFVDLQAQHRAIRGEIRAAIEGVLESTQFVLGPEVKAFEEAFAAFCQTKHTVAVNSGTSALVLGLLAAGVGRGDEVIAPAMTFMASVAAIDTTGARTVLVDVDPVSYTLDPAQIEDAVTDRTKAIMPVHLYGQPADMDPILDIARRHGLLVIEDAAQAHGAEYMGRRCGSLGDIAAFSFYPTKNLGACGEAGAVTTNRDDLESAVRKLRQWGQEVRGEHELKGGNYRMDGIQGAVLGVKMRYIDAWTEGRRRVAACYDELLADAECITTPAEMPYARHVYHVYAVLVENRDEIRARLAEAGVATSIHYPRPIHLHPCLADWGYRRGEFPVAERLADNGISLPMFPELTDDQIAAVCDALKREAVDLCVRTNSRNP